MKEKVLLLVKQVQVFTIFSVLKNNQLHVFMIEE